MFTLTVDIDLHRNSFKLSILFVYSQCIGESSYYQVYYVCELKYVINFRLDYFLHDRASLF